MLTLYDYQQSGIDAIRKKMADGKRKILRQSPTGAGKTVEFSYIVSEMKKQGKRALILTNRVELLYETGGTLEEFNLRPYYIQAGQMVTPPKTYQVYVAMAQTLQRRIGKWGDFWQWFDLVIIDECHLQSYNVFFGKNAFPQKTYILGFSATPLRTGKMRQLGDDYEVMIEGLQVPELIKRKRLVRDIYYGSENAPSMQGVKINTKGDYQEGQMYERFNKRELYAGVVDNWRKLTPNTVTLVFCVNIQHVVETCKEFNRAGIPAKFITSPVALPQKPVNGTDAQMVKYEIKKAEYNNWHEAYQKYSGDRGAVLKSWKRNDFHVLINSGILTTGFNRKDIETIIINRATVSIPLWLQMLGRGSRTYPGKEHFNILDFGGNAAALGYYNQMREWSLFHDQRKSDGAAPVKSCGGGDPISGEKGKPDKNGREGCGAYIFASAQVCPYCGYLFEQDKEIKAVDLVQIDYAQPLKTEEPEWKKLERIAESRGYKHGWVINQIIAKGGEDALAAYCRARGDSAGRLWRLKQIYKRQLRRYVEEHVA